MVYFSSSAIRGALYDAGTRVLTVQFASGPKLYDYIGVPQSIWDGLRSASSHGTYFDRHIRNVYSVNKR